jgi:hypothetical protein
MVLFLAKRRLTPTKEAHDFGAVSKGLQCPETHYAGKRSRVVWSPVRRTWLLFHHPPPASSAGTIEVVVEGTEVRIARTKKVLAVFLRKERKRG